MRPILLGLCLFAAACSGQALNSPTSPTNASLGSRRPRARLGRLKQAARGGTELPFRGSLHHGLEVPPPSAARDCRGYSDPPRSVHREVAAEVIPTVRLRGPSRSLRRMATSCLAPSLGEGVFIPPNTARITEVATIENGTGRFAGATGTFTMVRSTRSISRRARRLERNVRRTDQLEQIKVALRMRGRFDALLKATVGSA